MYCTCQQVIHASAPIMYNNPLWPVAVAGESSRGEPMYHCSSFLGAEYQRQRGGLFWVAQREGGKKQPWQAETMPVGPLWLPPVVSSGPPSPPLRPLATVVRVPSGPI